MARLASNGIEVYLPTGWDGRIFQRAPSGGGQTNPVAHFSTFPLPADIGDFGSGATTAMGPDDIFGVLFEYGPESLGTALFSRVGMPRDLTADQFHPYTLRRGVGGQSGTQWFFTEQQRPLTLYVVIGSHAKRYILVPRVNLLLNQITVLPRASVGR